MGVAGLWDVLRPVGKTRSLTHVSVKDGFEANPDGKRGFRVGIDASIWFYHATYGREGENPELRTLFFRCSRLMIMPFLPLFVFDGPKRPEVKRGKRISGKNHWMVQGMQEIISAFGFEWRMAPGEAEAELAYLNRIGVIEAVLSDDVDTFLFGATMVIRNPSTNLSGNRAHSLKNAAGKDDGNHVATYTSADILRHSDVQLSQGGLILIGVLRGGDYSDGLHGCGIATAHGLAKAGYGDSLLRAARTLERDDLEDFLVGWREELRAELRTNSRGRLQRKCPSLAKAINEDLPNIEVLLSYTNPITSEAKRPGHRNTVVDWDKEPDLGKIAALCEMYFEWGIKPIIIKRFRTVLWPSAVLRIVRRAAIIKDRKAGVLGSKDKVFETPRKNGKERRAPPGTPSSMIAKHFSTMALNTPGRVAGSGTGSTDDEEDDEDRLIVKIHSSRKHPSTDYVLEYRLEIAPAQLVRLCEAGIRGLRTELPPDLSESDDADGDDDDDDEGGEKKKGAKKTKKPPPNPESHLRMWLPACMVEVIEPEMVDEFEGVQRMKADKKAAKAANPTGVRDALAKLPAVTRLLEEEESDSENNLPLVRPKVAKPSTASAVQKSRSKTTSRTKADKTATAAGPSGVGFFAAKKLTSAATTSSKTTKAKMTSSTAQVADLFKDITVPDESTDNDVPPPPPSSRLTTTSSSTHTSVSRPPVRSSSSRILSFLDSQSSSVPAQRSSQSEAPVTSPIKQRVLRPFPMNFDAFMDDEISPLASSSYGEASSKSSSIMTRTHSNLSVSADPNSARKCALQKSPRRSEKHTSPRNTPSKKKTHITPGKEEEEESSDSERPPSPSPYKGRQPIVLGSLARNVGSSSMASPSRQEEEEESPPPSPIWSKATDFPPIPIKPLLRPPAGRKAAPLPADLSIISISSDSDTDLPPTSKMAPLLVAKARAAKASSVSRPMRPAARKPHRIHEADDIIDLT